MLVFFGTLYAALSASPYKDSARSGALRLDLAGAIVEQPARPTALDAVAGSATREYRLAEVIAALDAAARDDRIKAVALDLDLLHRRRAERDRQCRRGARPGAARGQARGRLCHRL